MATKRAKTLTDDQFEKLVKHVKKHSPMVARDMLIVMLSFKAGLRVGEIAKIAIKDMLDAEGNVAPYISIFSHVGKKKREREVPMHPMVRDALVTFRKTYPNAKVVAVSSQPFRFLIDRHKPIPLNATFRHMTVKAVTNHYMRILHAVGFEGVSTHSGRRTFGTKAARLANHHHSSLRDVQRLLGHARLDTTEAYVEASEDVHSLVMAL